MIPEVRQDCRPGSRTFGCTATKLPAGSPLGDYGIMQPGTEDQPLHAGGSYKPAEFVKDWAVLINPGFAIEAGS